MAVAFHYSENSAFSPVPYEATSYDYAPASNASVELLASPTYDYEIRANTSLADHWVTLHHHHHQQQAYEPGFHQYSLLAYPYLQECLGEPGFIRKRNERERMRVRNVNEGYARLREHLPLEPSEKRLSKVETLRGAIKYIKLLQRILDDCDEEKIDTQACQQQVTTKYHKGVAVTTTRKHEKNDHDCVK